MGLYRKKPVVIEAIQLVEANKEAILEFVAGSTREIHFGDYSSDGIFITIRTLEGVMTANENDWIIKGVQGEFYPCKPDIFEQTYEEV